MSFFPQLRYKFMPIRCIHYIRYKIMSYFSVKNTQRVKTMKVKKNPVSHPYFLAQIVSEMRVRCIQ